MHLASRALAAGADFTLLGPARTQIRASVPVIAVSAVRTGCGKSQTARYLSSLLKAHGRRVAVIRHPMPYGDLARQALALVGREQKLGRSRRQIFARLWDLAGGAPVPDESGLVPRAAIPYLNEPWYC